MDVGVVKDIPIQYQWTFLLVIVYQLLLEMHWLHRIGVKYNSCGGGKGRKE